MITKRKGSGKGLSAGGEACIEPVMPLEQLAQAFRDGWRPKCPDLPPLSKEAMAPIRLIYVIDALRNGRPIGGSTALYLADALEEALANPSNAAEALGIKRPRGRGTSHTYATYMKLAMHVNALKGEGCALPPSNRDRGAYERVADHFHTSVDTVERAWKMYGLLLEQWAEYEANEPPIS